MSGGTDWRFWGFRPYVRHAPQIYKDDLMVIFDELLAIGYIEQDVLVKTDNSWIPRCVCINMGMFDHDYPARFNIGGHVNQYVGVKWFNWFDNKVNVTPSLVLAPAQIWKDHEPCCIPQYLERKKRLESWHEA